MFRFRILLVFLAFVVVVHGAAHASNLHVIVVCDTHAISIGRSVEADCSNILKEIDLICKYTKLNPKIKTFRGMNVDSDFLDAISQLHVNQDDVIFFYWSGHGGRFFHQEDPWPLFDFEYDSQMVSQYEVTQQLRNKKPRLLLSIADCCNEYLDRSLFGRFDKKKNNNKRENYQTLFLLSSGTYMASGAEPGDISFGLNGHSTYLGIPAGGFFTNAFLQSLHIESSLKNSTISWDLIFQSTLNKTIEFQENDPDDPYIYQHPQYQYFPN